MNHSTALLLLNSPTDHWTHSLLDRPADISASRKRCALGGRCVGGAANSSQILSYGRYEERRRTLGIQAIGHLAITSERVRTCEAAEHGVLGFCSRSSPITQIQRESIEP